MQWPSAFFLLFLFFAVVLALPSGEVVPESVRNGKRLQEIAQKASFNVFSTLDHGSPCTKKHIVIRKEWCVEALRKLSEF